ncbi:hypothetical protein DV736_g4370, partial [Chaetothyriales sp. CBS 134916]
MKLLILAIYTLTLAFALAGDSHASNKSALVTNDNPWRVSYQATLQADKPVQGSIVGVSGGNGTGVNLAVNFFSLPDDAGPFEYHIHENPVPSNGSCDTTGEHLDPFNATEIPPCSPQSPSACQVGDLSGKHCKINEAGLVSIAFFQTQYLDLYLSTNNNNVAFFGNRSLVVHAANGTRLNCGSFVLVHDFSGGNDTSSAIAAQTGGSPAGVHLAIAVGALGVAFVI